MQKNIGVHHIQYMRVLDSIEDRILRTEVGDWREVQLRGHFFRDSFRLVSGRGYRGKCLQPETNHQAVHDHLPRGKFWLVLREQQSTGIPRNEEGIFYWKGRFFVNSTTKSVKLSKTAITPGEPVI